MSKAEDYFMSSPFVTSDLLELGNNQIGLNLEVLYEVLEHHHQSRVNAISDDITNIFKSLYYEDISNGEARVKLNNLLKK